MHRRSYSYCSSLFTILVLIAPAGAHAAPAAKRHHHHRGATIHHVDSGKSGSLARLHLPRLHLP